MSASLVSTSNSPYTVEDTPGTATMAAKVARHAPAEISRRDSFSLCLGLNQNAAPTYAVTTSKYVISWGVIWI